MLAENKSEKRLSRAVVKTTWWARGASNVACTLRRGQHETGHPRGNRVRYSQPPATAAPPGGRYPPRARRRWPFCWFRIGFLFHTNKSTTLLFLARKELITISIDSNILQSYPLKLCLFKHYCVYLIHRAKPCLRCWPCCCFQTNTK